MLEPDLLEAQSRQIHWAEHLVFVYPVLQGACRRCCRASSTARPAAGFAFRYRGTQDKDWEQLLAGAAPTCWSLHDQLVPRLRS